MINSRPLCNTACNIKPSCSMNKPQVKPKRVKYKIGIAILTPFLFQVDYAVQGQTTFCKPKPVVTSMVRTKTDWL